MNVMVATKRPAILMESAWKGKSEHPSTFDHFIILTGLVNIDV
jgi:hypothetical protein